MPNYRVLPPVSVAQQTLYRPGNGGAPRVLCAEPSEFLDVNESDLDALTANGWIKVALVGPTAQRPPLAGTVGADVWSQYGATLGRRYIDTDLGAFIVFDGAAWRNPLTGAEV